MTADEVTIDLGEGIITNLKEMEKVAKEIGNTYYEPVAQEIIKRRKGAMKEEQKEEFKGGIIMKDGTPTFINSFDYFNAKK